MAREYIQNEVQKFRLDRGITQGDLAAAAGVSRQTIIAIEKGNYTPSVHLALRVARFFKTPVERLFLIAREK